MTILTWFWKNKEKGYISGVVNKWARMVRKHVNRPGATIACVTDTPAGIDPRINIIPIPKENPPTKFSAKFKHFPRLNLFHPAAEKIFGDTEFLCMDLDCVVLNNIDSLLDTESDETVKFFRSPQVALPYSVCIQYIKAGAHPEVYESLYNYKEILAAYEKFGELLFQRDNLWLQHCLGPDVPVWTEKDGIYGLHPRVYRRVPKEDLKIVFSYRGITPWGELPKSVQFFKDWYKEEGGL